MTKLGRAAFVLIGLLVRLAGGNALCFVGILHHKPLVNGLTIDFHFAFLAIVTLLSHKSALSFSAAFKKYRIWFLRLHKNVPDLGVRPCLYSSKTCNPYDTILVFYTEVNPLGKGFLISPRRAYANRWNLSIQGQIIGMVTDSSCSFFIKHSRMTS